VPAAGRRDCPAGRDEFAILLNGLGDDSQANAIAFRIQHALRAPFAIGGREVFTSASIGIAFGPSSYTNPDEVMRDADTAMYHAKARGKARHEVFDADMHARVRDRLSLENDLMSRVSCSHVRCRPGRPRSWSWQIGRSVRKLGSGKRISHTARRKPSGDRRFPRNDLTPSTRRRASWRSPLLSRASDGAHPASMAVCGSEAGPKLLETRMLHLPAR
jgi:hypothetical protein